MREVNITHEQVPGIVFRRQYNADASVEEIAQDIARCSGCKDVDIMVLNESTREMRAAGTHPLRQLSREEILHATSSSYNPVLADLFSADISNMPKFQMSQEDYIARENTAHKYIVASKQKWLQAQKDCPGTKEMVSLPKVGSRCEGIGGIRGSVVWAGDLFMALPGLSKFSGVGVAEERWWVGIELDDPLGSNSSGEGLFGPTDKGFLSPLCQLKCGGPEDFPPRDPFESYSDTELYEI